MDYINLVISCIIPIMFSIILICCIIHVYTIKHTNNKKTIFNNQKKSTILPQMKYKFI